MANRIFIVLWGRNNIKMSDWANFIFYSLPVSTASLGVWCLSDICCLLDLLSVPLLLLKVVSGAHMPGANREWGPQTHVVSLRSLQASALGWLVGQLRGLKNNHILTSHLALPVGLLLETGPGLLTLLMRCSHTHPKVYSSPLPVSEPQCLHIRTGRKIRSRPGREAHFLRLISPVSPSASGVFPIPLYEDIVQT